MNLATMERATAGIISPVLMTTRLYLQSYRGVPVTLDLWELMIRWLFKLAFPASREVAVNARRLYDAERARVIPGAPRHDVELDTLPFRVFYRDMMALSSEIVGRELDEDAITRVQARTARAIENSGRWTIMHAAESADPWLDGEEESLSWMTDDEKEKFSSKSLSKSEYKEILRDTKRRRTGIKGWARVPTGAETCAWCLMLCSRGAAYRIGKTVGLSIEVRDFFRYEREGSFDPKEHMHQWHDNCDCKVVPVFDLDDWDGKDRADALYDMWGDVTAGFSGNDAVNAFRRAVNAGVSFKDYM